MQVKMIRFILEYGMAFDAVVKAPEVEVIMQAWMHCNNTGEFHAMDVNPPPNGRIWGVDLRKVQAIMEMPIQVQQQGGVTTLPSVLPPGTSGYSRN
jgi:hypothetical protein